MSGFTFTHRNQVDRSPPGHARMHQALFYEGDREYLEGVLKFIAPALKAGTPVAAAIPSDRGELLRSALNDKAGAVEILDMCELGANPARIIPAIERLLTRHGGAALHYVGEAIWPGRSAEEIQEATKHDALMNLAWRGSPIRALCAYDAAGLPADILADAERTHPTVIRRGSERPSPAYSGSTAPEGSDQPLPSAPAGAAELPFGIEQLHRARALVGEHATAAGLRRSRVQDLVLAISELATNAIRHGRGGGMLRVWTGRDRIVCQVDDDGHIRDPLAGYRLPLPDVAGGIGLWAVNQLCDLVEIRSSQEGTTVRVHTLLD